MPFKPKDQTVGARLRVVVIQGCASVLVSRPAWEHQAYGLNFRDRSHRHELQAPKRWTLTSEAAPLLKPPRAALKAQEPASPPSARRCSVPSRDGTVGRQSYFPSPSPPAAQGWQIVLSDIAMQKYR